jgi:hypothetical protein
MLNAEKRVTRRVRKSRQKEAAGAADVGPMQIEWRRARQLIGRIRDEVS